jgi:hypothetical protein
MRLQRGKRASQLRALEMLRDLKEPQMPVSGLVLFREVRQGARPLELMLALAIPP